MAWVPLEDSSITATLDTSSSAITLDGSRVISDGSQYADFWAIVFSEDTDVRLTMESYNSTGGCPWENTALFANEPNTAVDPMVEWVPNVVELEEAISASYSAPMGGECTVTETYSVLVEVWEEGPDPPAGNYYVYEMEKGFSFDGNYIPHFLELNWLFGDDPFTIDAIQKIRIHGLAKGVVNLQVKLAGMQGDPATDYISDYMIPQFIDLPFTPIHVSDEFVSVTNYVDYSDRGLALQMLFEGRNTDITKPEPAHVIQVLALQSSPQGNGKRSN